MANSKIYLCKGINVDKNYLNVLSYSETNMLNLCISKKIAEASDFQFIRESNRINVPFSYNVCMQANYIAFQNPTYSNKWFFAFIDKRNYKSDGATELEYTVDIWSTWFSYWSAISCYVVREHIASDTVGANIVPEDFSVSKEDMVEVNSELLYNTGTAVYCVAVNRMYEGYVIDSYGGCVLGGVPVGYNVFAFGTFTAMSQFLDHFKDEPEKVVGVYLLRSNYLNDGSERDYIHNTGDGTISPLQSGDGKTINKTYTPVSTTLDGYTPKNNKLFTYPYRYIKLTNGMGGAALYAIEKFTSTPAFDIVLNKAMTGGYMAYSTNYGKTASTAARKQDNISSNGQVTGSWQGDGQGQWIANNGVATAVSTVGSLAASGATIAAGAATANPALVAGGVMSAASTIGNLKQTFDKVEHLSNPIVGGCNSLAILHTADAIDPMVEEYTLRAQIARVIDDYFTKYGYATKQLKTPNITGRTNYNYIQVQGAIGKGDLPSEAMDKINEICNRGVHIWHNHANIGNFSVAN